jgi:hypothetical protein
MSMMFVTLGVETWQWPKAGRGNHDYPVAIRRNVPGKIESSQAMGS